jgi:hypothetical protein
MARIKALLKTGHLSIVHSLSPRNQTLALAGNNRSRMRTLSG